MAERAGVEEPETTEGEIEAEGLEGSWALRRGGDVLAGASLWAFAS